MKTSILALVSFLISSTNCFAEDCHDRFADLLTNGNSVSVPVRLHITQEIVGGKTSLNYHYSDGEGNGMTEMIDPINDPWSLFIGDKMYMSKDKGKSWSFINSWDAEKSKADTKAALMKDAEDATEITCSDETIDGVSHEVVEGTYKSSIVSGASIFQKFWVNKDAAMITKTYSHLTMSGFESKTTQVVEKYADFVLPKPE